MFFLRRLPPASSRTLARGQATAAAASAPSRAASSTPARPAAAASKASSAKSKATPARGAASGKAKAKAPPASATSTPERVDARKLAQKKPARTRRPQISLAKPRNWHRPIVRGLVPAYDAALELIREDAAAVQAEAAELRARLESGKVPAAQRAEQEKRLGILDVMGKINMPDVRWKAANGMADMNEPVYRHLVEQRWRNDGPVDLLMERLHQMSIIPDLLPDFHPSLDLRLTAPHKRVARAKPVWKAVEPGVFLHTSMMWKPPRLYTTAFHTEPRLYTMLMVDADVPDQENASFTTFLHWLKPNITLSSATGPLDLSSPHTPYIPPHPAQGTPYHRYAILLLPQTRTILPGPQTREGFSVREFVEEHGLLLDGGGAHMFRAVWDEASSHVWEQILKKPMPRYGVIPRPDLYAHYKTTPKYPPISPPRVFPTGASASVQPKAAPASSEAKKLAH